MCTTTLYCTVLYTTCKQNSALNLDSAYNWGFVELLNSMVANKSARTLLTANGISIHNESACSTSLLQLHPNAFD